MAATQQRVSVTRVPREKKFINQINPNENNAEIQKDPSTSHLKSHHLPRVDETSIEERDENDISRTKTDVFTLSVPRLSDTKSEDLNLQNTHTESSPPSIPVQHQPAQINSWLTRSSENFTRPHLNWKVKGKWSHNLCSLPEDWNMCCYACACWCCFRHEISSMMGEHWCLWFLNCAPLMELRIKFRQQYGIQGSIAEDFCLSTFCPLCVALQLANEGRNHGHRIFN